MYRDAGEGRVQGVRGVLDKDGAAKLPNLTPHFHNDKDGAAKLPYLTPHFHNDADC